MWALLLFGGAIHQVMSRGIEGRSIFADDEDRAFFLKLLSHGIKRTGFRCYAWVLMDNHYHFVIRINQLPLSALFKSLNAAYARYFGKKHGRHGYLFQDRFKSIATQDQKYLEELIRYVHLNPVRAGVCASVKHLDAYPWCGHAMLVGSLTFPFQTIAPVLKRFGSTRSTAIDRYRTFLAEGLETESEDDFIAMLRDSNQHKENIHGPGCWVIGDRDFVTESMKADAAHRLRIARYKRAGWNLEKVAIEVAKLTELDVAEIEKRGHVNTRSTARKVLAAVAHRQLGIPNTEIARYLGIGAPAVSKSLDEGEKIARKLRIGIVN